MPIPLFITTIFHPTIHSEQLGDHVATGNLVFNFDEPWDLYTQKDIASKLMGSKTDMTKSLL